MASTSPSLELPGRVLFLCTSPAQMAAQLKGTSGATVDLMTAGPLRDDISTDEITPVAILSHYDEKLGRYPYTGFRVDGEQPVAVSAVLKGGFSVTVAGSRYGKGSSREHSNQQDAHIGQYWPNSPHIRAAPGRTGSLPVEMADSWRSCRRCCIYFFGKVSRLCSH